MSWDISLKRSCHERRNESFTSLKEEPLQSEEGCSVPSLSMGMEQSWPEELPIRRELLLRIGTIRRSFTWPSTRISTGSHGIFPTFCAARMQPEDRMVNERRRPS